MVAAGDKVRITFEGEVKKVGPGVQVWVLVNGCWFRSDEWETVDD